MLARCLGREAAALVAGATARPENLGAVRPACVLFADIRRFSRLAERVDLLLLRRFLCDFVGIFVETVEGAGGMANKFMGDGALALFVDPPDAGRAVEAAFALQAAFAAARARWRGTDAAFADIDLAAGLGYGEIFLGAVGAGERFDFTAIGCPVNIAERLAADPARTGEGGVFCDGRFLARLGDSAPPSCSLGRVRLRGMGTETEIFRLSPSIGEG